MSSITDRSIELPTWDDVQRVVLLQDYNTRVVVLGTMLLGLAAGIIGTFMLLRKRALLGDALSHATLPGIGIAFIAATLAGRDGKSLPLLLTGATVSGALGVGAVLLIRHSTRLKEDTALGIVLSVFFGAGVAVQGVVQNLGTGHAAGLETFIYGKTASLLASDALAIGIAAAGVALFCAALFKEFRLLCFDAGYAAGQGWPVLLLDVLMMAAVTVVTVIGLQAVGLVLIIALLIIPAAAARFWTERMVTMTIVSALIGATSAMVGAGASGLWPRLPSGAMIVIAAALGFLISMMLGSARGILPRWKRQRTLERRIGRQHLLRAMREADETGSGVNPLSVESLLAMRSWSRYEVLREIRRAGSAGLVTFDGASARLTDRGRTDAARITRNHRLWEIYLITHADIAPTHVDRDADHVEHVLDPALLAKLERMLAADSSAPGVPASPHALAPGAPA